MTGSRRLETGGSIDRTRPIGFVFDGREHEGFRGDTLASALLAGGIDVVSRSPIMGRPRGVLSAGPEEPSAFVSISEPYVDVIAPATTVDLIDGLVAEGRAGVGALPPEPPRLECEHRNAHVETLVVGGGRTGVRSAGEALARGDRVMLVDERARADGWRSSVDPDVVALPRATALGLYDAGFVLIHERCRPVERLWHVRARRVVLATGAHERLVAFADDDRPGIMLCSAVRAYLQDYAVRLGERVVVFTTNAGVDYAAVAMRAAGGSVTIVDVRAGAGDSHEAARESGIDVRIGWTVVGTNGDERLESVELAGPNGERERLDADLLAVSGGWNPAVQLWRMIGGGLRFDGRTASFVPDGDGPSWLSVVGAAAGNTLPRAAPYWFVPGEDYSRHFVDLQRDQTIADIAGVVEGGLRSVEHVKRATYIGTAIDQGRLSSVVTAEVVNHLLRADPGAQGPTSARPPCTPISYAAVAGWRRGGLFDPIRRTPIHPWHVERGAEMENVGQWRRPRCFPGPNEDLDAAVERECLTVRTGVGAMDASTLGKIEVAGPDAAVFLDRMYTNRMSTLRTGRIRYGMLLGLDGMVLDDGVAMRLADDRFLVTATTGGAAKVLDHFEEWLQTEWPRLRVYCTSVTEQWSTIAVAGPRARELLLAMGTDIDVSVEAFPFMTFRDGAVAGMPSRVARVSFSGELCFEINVAGWHGAAAWEAVLAAGDRLGVAPYGTEAMHVLRAEKGFAIVGQDTDGTVTPLDLGMDWIVDMDKGDFVGRRSLRRPDTMRPDRRQLVGLLPVDPNVRLPEGAQLVLEDTGRIPMPMIGHVTSSYRSPVLGRAFALAMVRRGRELVGRTLYAPLPEGTIAAEVTRPVLYDPDNRRRDGEAPPR